MEKCKNACKEFQKEMKTFLNRKWTDTDAVRISKELRRRLDMLFTFMDHEGVPWHNNDAERAIRQGVLHRKISGGRRTWTGAEAFEVLLSTYETAKKRGDRFIAMVKAKFDPPAGGGGCELGAS
jgi:transposase